jgi:hypothetical protein
MATGLQLWLLCLDEASRDLKSLFVLFDAHFLYSLYSTTFDFKFFHCNHFYK